MVLERGQDLEFCKIYFNGENEDQRKNFRINEFQKERRNRIYKEMKQFVGYIDLWEI